MLAAYLSGHGFGHMVRLCEVLRRVRELAPGLPIEVAGVVPEPLVREEVGDPLEVRLEPFDVGLVQVDALEVDEAATLERCRAFDLSWNERADREADRLRARGARLVLSDIPALPFDAAERARVPAIGLANFSWSFIYTHLSRRIPGLEESAKRAARAYRSAELLLELPFASDLSEFPHRERVGFVARRARLGREAVRRRLGLPSGPVALFSFGGSGLPWLRTELLEPDPEVHYLLPGQLPEGRLRALELRYPDVVGAVDVVVTKPGYGIVTDAIAAGTRMVYTERGDFPEYPILVREMSSYLACVHIPGPELRAGKLRTAIHRVLSQAMPRPPDLEGADRAARRILDLMGGRGHSTPSSA